MTTLQARYNPTAKPERKGLLYQEGFDAAVTDASSIVAKLLNTSELLLVAGEMTAGEKRTVKAVLTLVAKRIADLQNYKHSS